MGALAYALTPLTIALGSRESILTMFTGIPYQSFNFLHRWTGRIIFFQSVLHTFGWCLIEAKLYQPQPTVWKTFIAQLYMIWGVVAFVFIVFLFVFSLTPVIKLTGHEFFRKAHYIVAMLYIGACWGHWNQLYCWMLASLIVWGLDRGVRLLRTLLIHTRQIDGSTGLSTSLHCILPKLTNMFQASNSAPPNPVSNTSLTPTVASSASPSPKISKLGPQASTSSSASLLSQSGNPTPSPLSPIPLPTPCLNTSISHDAAKVKPAALRTLSWPPNPRPSHPPPPPHQRQ